MSVAAYARHKGRPTAEIDEAVSFLGGKPRAPQPLEGPKAGGYPAWMNDPRPASCRNCKAPMVLALQIGFPETPWGQLYVTTCASCPDRPMRLLFDLD